METWLYEIAKHAHRQESWYALDATYLKTAYFVKEVDEEVDGVKTHVKIKNAKLYVARGINTGIPVAWTITDDNANDQTQFPALLEQIVTRGGILEGWWHSGRRRLQ